MSVSKTKSLRFLPRHVFPAQDPAHALTQIIPVENYVITAVNSKPPKVRKDGLHHS